MYFPTATSSSTPPPQQAGGSRKRKADEMDPSVTVPATSELTPLTSVARQYLQIGDRASAQQPSNGAAIGQLYASTAQRPQQVRIGAASGQPLAAPQTFEYCSRPPQPATPSFQKAFHLYPQGGIPVICSMVYTVPLGAALPHSVVDATNRLAASIMYTPNPRAAAQAHSAASSSSSGGAGAHPTYADIATLVKEFSDTYFTLFSQLEKWTDITISQAHDLIITNEKDPETGPAIKEFAESRIDMLKTTNPVFSKSTNLTLKTLAENIQSQPCRIDFEFYIRSFQEITENITKGARIHFRKVVDISKAFSEISFERSDLYPIPTVNFASLIIELDKRACAIFNQCIQKSEALISTFQEADLTPGHNPHKTAFNKIASKYLKQIGR